MKYILKVIYGAEACAYADEHTPLGTIRAIKSNKIFGDYKEYCFETEQDRELAKQILEDSYGWDNNMWETCEK